MAYSRHIFVGRSKLVFRAVRILMCLRPQVQVHIDYLLAVQHHVYFVGLTGDSVAVPFADLPPAPPAGLASVRHHTKLFQPVAFHPSQ